MRAHRSTRSFTAKSEAYVDSSAWIAALDPSDEFHEVFAPLFHNPPRLITSALVVSEVYTWLMRRHNSNRAMQFFEFLSSLPAVMIRPFDTTDIQAAIAILNRFLDQRLTLADAHGLAILRDRKLSHCWSTDRHLALTGASLPIYRS